MVVEGSKHLVRSRSMLSLSNTMTDDERSIRDLGLPGSRKRIGREPTIPEGIAMKTFQNDTDNLGESSNGDLITSSPVQMSPVEDSRRVNWRDLPQNRALTFDDPWRRVRANPVEEDDRPPSSDVLPQRARTVPDNEPSTVDSTRRFSTLSNFTRRMSNARTGSAQRIVSHPYLTFTPTVERNSVR